MDVENPPGASQRAAEVGMRATAWPPAPVRRDAPVAPCEAAARVLLRERTKQRTHARTPTLHARVRAPTRPGHF